MSSESSAPPDDLVALVGSRLCHDLISPLSAISNGVELLAMSGIGNSPEMALIAESVTAANAKLKFFRIAFGRAAPGQQISAREIRAVLRDLGATGRLSVQFLPEGDPPRLAVKAAFLALLCLETALPWGGTVEITEDGGVWQLRARAERSKPDPALWAALDAPGPTLAPAQVQFALLPQAVAEMGRVLHWSLEPTGGQIRF